MKTHISFSSWNRYQECETKALAYDKGDYKMKPTSAMKASSLADVLLTGDEEAQIKFMEKNPDMYTLKGELKAEYKKIINCVERAKQDKEFMKYMKGVTQVELEGEIGGVPVKGIIDVLNENFITDLKAVKDFKKEWDSKHRQWVTWVQYRNYFVQGAIYRELYYQNTGTYLPFIIAALTKEEHSERAIITFPDDALDEALEYFTSSMQRIAMLRAGEAEPNRCMKCDYCKDTFDALHIDYRVIGLD